MHAGEPADDGLPPVPSTEPVELPRDPYAALRGRDFRLYLSGNVAAILGMQMQSAAVGWEIFDRTRSEWHLGLIGLVQFLPVVALTLVTGYVADHFDRRRVLFVCGSLMALASCGLVLVSHFAADVWLTYVCLFVTGVARSFQQPAKSSFLPQIVSGESFTNAVTWNTGGFHLSTVVGPALAGLVIWLTGRSALVYAIDALAHVVWLLTLTLIPARPFTPASSESTRHALVAGLRFVWRTKVILAAITLDMLAVLFGGATALLPIYATDILLADSLGYGMLRAAPAVGALAMAVILVNRPPSRRAGVVLLLSVAGFGVATIVFGVSRSFGLSLAMLFLTGALDNISVVIRHTLVQLQTPNEFRGRVSAVNALFIGASNELGGFESGAVAAWFKRPADPMFGPMVSVVSGGIGTLLVVAGVAALWPQLRRYQASHPRLPRSTG
jgi:MFS family permease